MKLLTLVLASATLLPAVLAQSTSEITSCFTSGDCGKWTNDVLSDCPQELTTSGLYNGNSLDISKLATATDLRNCVCSHGLGSSFIQNCLVCLQDPLKTQAETVMSSCTTNTNTTTSTTNSTSSSSSTPKATGTNSSNAVMARTSYSWGLTGAGAVIVGGLLLAI